MERLDKAVRERIATGNGQERREWLEQQERLSAAYVGTIHSFALRLLKNYGYRAQVPRTARTTQSSRLLADALGDALETSLNRADTASRSSICVSMNTGSGRLRSRSSPPPEHAG